MKAVVFVKILLIISLYCCQAFAIKPERIYHTRPLDFKMNYKEFKIKTPDNFNINIWEIESEIQIRTGKTIIICAGDAGNMGYYLRQANVLHQNGFKVILFDYRGFGESDDFKIDTTLLFHNEFLLDYETVLKEVKSKNNGSIGVWGFSMGGYFPMVLKEKPDFIILDSAMLNLEEILHRLNKPDLKIPKNSLKVLPNHIPTVAFWGQKDKITIASDNTLWNKNQVNIYYYGGHMQLFQSMDEVKIVKIIELFAILPYENK